ncbi:hypothetical protein XHV734_2672 [Xanthomonas hortorum pv. vitians]|nr:hypothetical protein XHV734_2672 [Xanthomonas hortorum pv. vitians]
MRAVCTSYSETLIAMRSGDRRRRADSLRTHALVHCRELLDPGLCGRSEPPDCTWMQTFNATRQPPTAGQTVSRHLPTKAGMQVAFVLPVLPGRQRGALTHCTCMSRTTWTPQRERSLGRCRAIV